MGLHICYELRLPQTTGDQEALRLLTQLRAYALTLDLDRVTTVCCLQGRELMAHHDRWKTWSLPWMLHVTARGIRAERDGQAGPVEAADRLAVAGFLVHPGRGSEAAIFGLVRPSLGATAPNAERAEEAENWFWHYCCKTQYASAVSDEHLVRCHLAVVEMLEEANRIGLGITVRDETHYWETRSTERLIAEVRNMNRIVARVAGALHDRLSPEHRAEGAIFEHPEFERLESEPVERPNTTRE